MSPTCFLTNKIIPFYLIVGGVPKRSSFKLLKWVFFLIYFYFCFFLYLRENVSGEGGQRKRENLFF